jgi:hypothetical protein
MHTTTDLWQALPASPVWNNIHFKQKALSVFA